jgi:hypothetical protein
MKATFNRSFTKAIAERPDGLNFKYIEYYAEPKSKTPTHKQAAQTMKARQKQVNWMDRTRRVRTDGIHGIDFATATSTTLTLKKTTLSQSSSICK